MNRVGIQGRGKASGSAGSWPARSRAFLPYAQARGDTERVERWEASILPELRKALETAGWDGGHYRRGYFDDGTSARLEREFRMPDRFDRPVLECSLR